ncbi:hypothetical protein Tco_1103399 [Tanacetum coccineum]
MAFGGNTHDLGSFGKETEEITDLHKDSPRIMFSERDDDITSTKRRHHDLFGDGVRKFGDSVSRKDDEVVFRMPQRTKELDLISSWEKEKFEAFFMENLKVIFDKKKLGSS